MGPRSADRPDLRAAVCRLLDDDAFPAAGRTLAASPELLSEAVDGVLDELASTGRYPEQAIEQMRAFLRRCRTAGLAAVFQPGREEIDPPVVAAVRVDMDEANVAEAEFERTGDVARLDVAAAAWRRIASHPDLGSAYPGLRAALLNNAAGVLLRRYWTAGEQPDLDDARNLFGVAAALTPTRSTARAHRLGNLAMAAREVHLRTGAAAALDDAVAVLREAAGAAGRSAAAGEVLTNLALALRDRVVRTGDPGDLAEAIAAAERASEMPGVGGRLMLGGLLGLRYRMQGADADLTRSVRLLDDGLAAFPSGHPDRPRRQVDLAIALLDRHATAADPADLSRAVALCEDAVTTLPRTSPDRPACLAQWSNALYRRYESTGLIDDLDRAVDALEEAIDTARPGEVTVPGWRVNLATVLGRRATRMSAPADLDRAIALFAAAVDEDGVAADRFAAVTGLGNAHRDRARRTGSRDDAGRAVEVLRTALALAPEGTPHHPTALTNLGAALRDRYAHAGAVEDLDAALATVTLAVERSIEGDVDGPRRMFALAQAAGDRASLGSVAHVAIGVAAYRRGCATGVLVDPESTLTAAQDWARWAAQRRDWPEAADACAAAVAAVSALLERQVLRVHQETWLRDAVGLPAAAAWAAATAGRLRDAVTAVERTRAAILSEVLGRERADLDRLQQQAPDLAARYRRAVARVGAVSAA